MRMSHQRRINANFHRQLRDEPIGVNLCLSVASLFALRAHNRKRCPASTAASTWSHHLEYRRTIDELTVLHYLPDAARVANVCQRIAIKHHQVGPLSHFNSAEILVCAKYARGAARGGVYRLQRR